MWEGVREGGGEMRWGVKRLHYSVTVTHDVNELACVCVCVCVCVCGRAVPASHNTECITTHQQSWHTSLQEMPKYTPHTQPL